MAPCLRAFHVLVALSLIGVACNEVLGLDPGTRGPFGDAGAAGDDGEGGSRLGASTGGTASGVSGGRSGAGGTSGSGGATSDSAGGGSGEPSAGGVGASSGATSGMGGTASGAGSGAGTGQGVDECFFDGKRYANGTSFTKDCNVCSCDFPEVTCTTRDCSGGTGGVAGSAGASGGRGNSGGVSGAPSCDYADIGAFCILGNPIDSGDQLAPGMALRISLQPSGCHSSSCTRVVSAACNYLASDGDITVSSFLCLREEGEDCAGDCGGGSAECDVDLTLASGTHRVSIAGTPLQVTFTVPSVARPGALCTGSPNDK